MEPLHGDRHLRYFGYGLRQISQKSVQRERLFQILDLLKTVILLCLL